MIRRSYLLTALYVALSNAALAQPDVSVSVLPDWAEQLQIEEFTADRTGQFQLGVAHLLSDRQVRKTDDGYEYVERSAYRIIDRSGLEDWSTILRAFDPESESLAFNFVRVLRDGEVLDRLTSTEITLLRQESGLQNSIIDGNVTALIQLEDVRVGDIIDFSYSGSVTSTLWPHHIFESVPVAWSVPIAQSRFKLLVPEDLDVSVRSIAADVKPEIRALGGWRSFELHIRDPDPLPFQQNTPYDWVMFGFVQLTTMEAWSEIVDWAIPLFLFDEPVPAAFAARLDRIREEYERPEDRVIQALRLVQSDIRYLGLEAGLGSHVPRAPSVTLERAYGDCKDKAVLLVAALNYLGIEAVPVLASLASGGILPQLAPAISAFDHVIVEINLPDRKIWVDPTLSHQGGTADNLAPLTYGWVLPIRDGQKELVEVSRSFPAEPEFEIAETFEFSETGDVALRITVEQTYRNEFADVSRLQISTLGRQFFARSFIDYYAAAYRGVTESTSLSVTDDINANVMVLRAEYAMDKDTYEGADYRNNLPIYGTAVQDMLPRHVEARRTAPLALPYGTNVRHIVRIVTPGRRFPVPESRSRSAGGVSYALNFSQDGDAFVIEYVLFVNAKSAPLDLVESVTAIADEIARDSELTLYMNAAFPALQERLRLTTAVDQETEESIAVAASQLVQGQLVEALTTLNALLDGHPDATDLRGSLQLFKGTVLSRLGRNRAALAAFDEGFALYEPTTLDEYYTFITILSREREDARAVRMLERMLARHPEATESLDMQWTSAFLSYLRRLGLHAESDSLKLAITRAAHKHQPSDLDKFGWLFSDAVEMLVQAGELTEATEYLPHLSDPEDLALLLANRDTEALWDVIEEYAGADLSQVISAYMSSTRESAGSSPDDFLRLARHVGALRIAGRSQAAVAFAAPFVESWARIEAVGSDAYWFINEYAYALSEAGRAEEADALMSRLLSIGVEQNAALISMAINRASMLLHWAHFDAALAAASEIEGLGKEYASDYGWGWVYHAKACALHQLGRTDEAASVLRDSILPLADANSAAHTKTMLCLDEPEKAAELLIRRLRDETTRGSAISSFFHAKEDEPVPPFLAELHHRANLVRARPDVRRELDAVGRALPIAGAATYWTRF